MADPQGNEMQDKEIELKFLLPNPEQTLEKLRLMTSFVGEEHQKDTYYVPAHRNFLDETNVSEWLRIRESGEKSLINYKNFHKKENGPRTIHADEYETLIEDPESLKKIFSALDITSIIVVDKKRSIFMHGDAEIVVDIVDELGAFLEIEAKGNFMSVDEAKEYLHDVLNELEIDVGEQDFVGYPYLILKKKGLLNS